MNKVVLALVLFAAGHAMANDVYVGAGTDGFTLGVGTSFTEKFAVRAEGSYLNYGRDVDSGNVKYNANVNFKNLGLFSDFHPFENGLRLTAGILVGNSKVEGVANGASGSVNINGVDYSVAGESLKLEAKFPSTRQYVGFGYSNKASKGLGMFADVGVAIGKPKAKLNASDGLVTAAGQSNIDAEQQKAQEKLDKLKFWPVIKVGLSYKF